MENIQDTEFAIEVSGLTKIYKLYQQPFDRVKETFGRNKKKYYQEFFALNDISFAIKKGETIGFVDQRISR